MERYIWIKVTHDKYEHIVAMGDTPYELAKECGVTYNAICSAISHAKKRNNNSIYKKVVLIDEE